MPIYCSCCHNREASLRSLHFGYELPFCSNECSGLLHRLLHPRTPQLDREFGKYQYALERLDPELRVNTQTFLLFPGGWHQAPLPLKVAALTYFPVHEETPPPPPTSAAAAYIPQHLHMGAPLEGAERERQKQTVTEYLRDLLVLISTNLQKQYDLLGNEYVNEQAASIIKWIRDAFPGVLTQEKYKALLQEGVVPPPPKNPKKRVIIEEDEDEDKQPEAAAEEEEPAAEPSVPPAYVQATTAAPSSSSSPQSAPPQPQPTSPAPAPKPRSRVKKAKLEAWVRAPNQGYTPLVSGGQEAAKQYATDMVRNIYYDFFRAWTREQELMQALQVAKADVVAAKAAEIENATDKIPLLAQLNVDPNVKPQDLGRALSKAADDASVIPVGYVGRYMPGLPANVEEFYVNLLDLTETGPRMDRYGLGSDRLAQIDDQVTRDTLSNVSVWNIVQDMSKYLYVPKSSIKDLNGALEKAIEEYWADQMTQEAVMLVLDLSFLRANHYPLWDNIGDAINSVQPVLGEEDRKTLRNKLHKALLKYFKTVVKLPILAHRSARLKHPQKRVSDDEVSGVFELLAREPRQKLVRDLERTFLPIQQLQAKLGKAATTQQPQPQPPPPTLQQLRVEKLAEKKSGADAAAAAVVLAAGNKPTAAAAAASSSSSSSTPMLLSNPLPPPMVAKQSGMQQKQQQQQQKSEAQQHLEKRIRNAEEKLAKLKAERAQLPEPYADKTGDQYYWQPIAQQRTDVIAEKEQEIRAADARLNYLRTANADEEYNKLKNARRKLAAAKRHWDEVFAEMSDQYDQAKVKWEAERKEERSRRRRMREDESSNVSSESSSASSEDEFPEFETYVQDYDEYKLAEEEFQEYDSMVKNLEA